MISDTANAPASFMASVETDEQSAHRLADLVAECFGADDVAVSLVDAGGGRWRAAIHFAAAPNQAAVCAVAAAALGLDTAAALAFESVAAKDWVRDSLTGLAPVSAGRFVVHGAHDRAHISPNRIGIEIEAALAFGTGHHGTTRGCLLALDRLGKVLSRQRRAQPPSSPGKGERRYARSADHGGSRSTRLACARRPPPFRGRKASILDLGTGSGVLAIAAARALRQRVVATDIDPNAVAATRGNAARNGVPDLVEIIQADGVTAPRLRQRAPFDLIFANILLRPLQRLAVPLQRLAAPGAHVILSGLLPSQSNAALAAYRALTLERRVDNDGWTTLVFRRPPRPRPPIVARRRRRT